jgi:Na+/H+-translocating membrane pyrophosphatase
MGIIISAIQFALSGITSGQAWRSARKMIGSGSVTDE